MTSSEIASSDGHCRADGMRRLFKSGSASVLVALLVGIGVSVAPAAADEETFEADFINIRSDMQDDEWSVYSATSVGRQPQNREVQLRVPSSSVRQIGMGDEYAWHGEQGEARWFSLSQISTQQVPDTMLSLDDQSIKYSVDNVVGPGDFALYAVDYDPQNPPGSPSDLFRWGTGFQRDGSPQSLGQEFELPPRDRLPMEVMASASGMYCFDVTARATLADGTSVADTGTVRMAVGDQVVSDAGCGVATDEFPEGAEAPNAPRAPDVSVEGDVVSVGWEPPPSSADAPITGYTVLLTDHLGESLVQEIDGDTTSAVFEDVPAGRYSATVMAANEFGESRPSVRSDRFMVELQDGDTLVVTEGHIDVIAPQVDIAEVTGEKTLQLRAHHDDYGWLEWDQFVLYTDDQARENLPGEYTSGNDWSFIGEPGQDVWRSPITQNRGLPWVGLSTEHVSIREHVGHGNSVGLRIEGVTGPDGEDAPGEFAYSRVGSSPGFSGPPWNGHVEASSREGLPHASSEPVGNHTHYDWFFSEPGVYCVAVAIDAELEGERHTSRGQMTHIVGETVEPHEVAPCEANTEYLSVDAPPSVEAGDTGEPFVLDGGYGNLSLLLDDGELDTQLLHGGSFRNTVPEAHDLENVIFRADSLGGNYYFSRSFPLNAHARGTVPYLRWNTFGVDDDEVNGDITWTVDEVRGPGDFTVEQDRPYSPVFNTAEGATESNLWTQSGAARTDWYVSDPGKYCIDLTWSVQTVDQGEVSHSQTITVVADGEGPGNGEETFSVTCVDGADPSGPDPTDPPEEEILVLEQGHADIFYIALDEDSEPYLTLKEDVTGSGVLRDPATVELHVVADAVTEFPDSEGVPEGLRGESAHHLPLNQHPDVLWPGWDTRQVMSTGFRAVDITISDFEGPGDAYLWSGAGLGGTRAVLDDEQFRLPGNIHQDEPAHVHADWAFTEPGEYVFTARATLHDSVTGETFTTNESEYLFTVAEAEQPQPTPPGDPDPSPTPTQGPEPTETGSPSPTEGPTPTPTGDPSEDPTEGTTPDPTEEPTQSGGPTSTPEPTETASPDPTDRPTMTPSPTESGEPTASPSPTESPDPTDDRTVSPSPTDDPSDLPVPVEPSENELTSEFEDLIQAPEQAVIGEEISVTVGEEYVDQALHSFLFSSPVNLGSSAVDAEGGIILAIPKTDDLIGNHRLAVYEDSGGIIGWTSIELVPPTPDGGDEPGGASGNGDQDSGSDESDQRHPDSGGKGTDPGGSPGQSDAKDSGASLAATGMGNGLLMGAGLMLLIVGAGIGLLLLRRPGSAIR
ncbi:choice-of-anchor M domain-containing protein [Nesterenkonia haasae]|uniref:choice-of-anchor M domain-containing protein n=1 Tax=Nesterenkonia haasae TaxID=2587813 RepID=UPI00139123F7|nr:choice-of-anchor M domain-containing protein [Nesterenkonia haasae]NDK33153.1 hypothetical protein [Nesterenkonia haasae]